MFEYEVFSAEEAAQEQFKILPAGVYDAVIENAVEKTSSNGNPMIDLKLKVFDEKGGIYYMRDFLVFTKKMAWKVRHFAKAAKLLNEYEAGKLCAAIIINKHVGVDVGIKPGEAIPFHDLNGKPEGSKYPDNNKISDYVEKEPEYNKDYAMKDEGLPF